MKRICVRLRFLGLPGDFRMLLWFCGFQIGLWVGRRLVCLCCVGREARDLLGLGFVGSIKCAVRNLLLFVRDVWLMSYELRLRNALCSELGFQRVFHDFCPESLFSLELILLLKTFGLN